MWSCLRPNPQVGEAGIAHPSGWQPRQNVQVHVNVGNRAFAKPLRGPQPSEEGLPAPGTPARPLRVDTDDEGDIFEVSCALRQQSNRASLLSAGAIGHPANMPLPAKAPGEILFSADKILQPR